MTTPKYLQNEKTKAVFPYNERLLRNKNMVPYDGDPSTPEEEAEPITISSDSSDQPAASFSIKRAKKDELIAYAANEFGVQLEDDQTVAQLREQITKLSEEE